MKKRIAVSCLACVFVLLDVGCVFAMATDPLFDAMDDIKREIYDSEWAERSVQLEDRITTMPVTVLAISAENGTPEEVQKLIDMGEYVSKNFLFSFVKNGVKNPEVIRVLQRAGADIEARDEYGNTVLMRAALWGKPEVVKIFLQAGANVNAVNKDGETALMKAAEYGLLAEDNGDSAVNLLIDAGADIKIKDKNGETALDKARTRTGDERLKNDTLKRLGASWYHLHWF